MHLDDSFDVLGFGETMIRLSAPRGTRLEDANQLELTVGGAESNVAVALSKLGRRTAWVSGLVKNPLGQRVSTELRARGVDTSLVVWSEAGRVGVYFLDAGVEPRPTRVYYDRAGSAVAALEPDAIDPAVVLRARALHLTGITPALSAGCAAICERLAQTAVDAGIPLVFDVNYRARLWSAGVARSGLERLLRSTTLLFCGAADAERIWDLTGAPQEIAAGLLAQSRANTAVVTLGAGGALAMRRDGTRAYQDALAVSAVDAVGAGDAFAAGYIDRWLADDCDLETALRSGVALAALKMTVAGDHASADRAELDAAIALLDRPGVDIIR